MANRNSLVVRGARQAMEQFKTEVASELGLQNYDDLDKGELTSRQNGYVGGNMTKKMVAFAEAEIATRGAAAVAQTTAQIFEAPQRIIQMNQAASQGNAPGLQAAPIQGLQGQQFLGQGAQGLH